jgi:hypothetical protein
MTSPSKVTGHGPPGGQSPNRACSGIKANGERCKAIPISGSEWCFSHHPDHAGKHARNGRKGGHAGDRGRPRSTTRELSDTRRELREILASVRSGELERGIGTALFQGYSVLLRAIEVERRAFEDEELLRRVEELEQLSEERSTRAWRR